MKYLLIVVMTLMINHAFAQGDTLTEATRELTFNQSKKLSVMHFTPLGNGGLKNMISDVSLASEFKEGASGKFDLKYTCKKYWITAGAGVLQKIGKSDKEATPFDLHGIQPGTTVKFSFQKFFWRPKMSQASFDHFIAAKKKYAAKHNIEDSRYTTIQDILEAKDENIKKELKKAKLKVPVFFNIDYSFTQNKFEYAVDSTTLAKQTKNHITHAASATIGLAFARNPYNQGYLSFSYEFESSYKEGDKVTKLTPFGSTSNVVTQEVIFGAPVLEKDHKLSTEWRSNILVSKNEDEKRSFAIGLAPSITYGISSEKIAMVLPIYFINGRLADGKPSWVQAGIKFGYATSTAKLASFKDGFGTQIILTVPFDAFASLN